MHVDGVNVCTLSQAKYAKHVVAEFCKAAGVPSLPCSKVPAMSFDVELADEPAVFGKCAAHFIGMLAYLARYTRPELIFSVYRLSRFLQCWTRVQDVELSRIMRFLAHTQDHCLELRMCPADAGTVMLRADVDADHAACPLTRKSTSGVTVMIVGPHSLGLVAAASKAIPNPTRSSGESELVTVARYAPLYIRYKDIAADVLARPLRMLFRTDASVVLANIKQGFSRLLHYMQKYQQVNVAFLHYFFYGKSRMADIIKVDTLDNTADVHTKVLVLVKLDAARKQLGVISKP